MALKVPYTHAAKAKRAETAGIDPRFIDLARLLARDAAEARYEDELTKANTDRKEQDPP